MAQSGTITSTRDSNRGMVVSITGVTTATNTPSFRSFGYPIGSFALQGTYQTTTAATAQLQGSNDGGTTWVAVGTGYTSAANPAPASGSLIGANNEVFQLYRFNVTSGDAGTNLSFYVYLASTFG